MKKYTMYRHGGKPYGIQIWCRDLPFEIARDTVLKYNQVMFDYWEYWFEEQ